MKLAGGAVAGLALLLGLSAIFVLADPIAPLPNLVSEPLGSALWEKRGLDVLGQMLLILGGTFGVLVLTKERIANS